MIFGFLLFPNLEELDLVGEETAGRVQLAAEYYPSGKRFGNAHRHEKAPRYVASAG